jgi:hypothetical protein
MIERNPRDDLFEQLKYGRIDPDAAEAEVRRLGLEPLRPAVDLSRFDPSRETQWTIAMAVAWIAYRTIDAVRDAWNPYREQCCDWHFRKWRIGFEGEVFEGWFLEPRSPETMAMLLIGDTLEPERYRDPKFNMTASAAKEALWVALQTDCFRATGIDTDTDTRVQIVPFTWIDLKLFEQDGRDEVRPHSLRLTGPNRYRDVLIPSASIRGLWREPYEKPALTLPETIMPTGDGYMPLTSAAQWIATEGGTTSFVGDDVERWRPAFEKLLAAIGSDRVRVIGTKNGARELVPGYHFVDCPVQFPHEGGELEMILGEQVHLGTYTYDSEEEWRDGFSDALIGERGKVLWNRLVVAKEDVLALWPFRLEEPPKSGLPGRPTSRHAILGEFRRRVASGIFLKVLSGEAEQLAEWLERHPQYPPAGAGAIANMIREEHRAAKAMKS